MQTPKAGENDNLEQFAQPERMVEEFQAVARTHEGIASVDFNNDNNYKQYLNEV